MNAMETKSGAPGENLVLAISELFQTQLVPAKRGLQTAVRVNGRRCFVNLDEGANCPGDVWMLKLDGENPAKTVYFANPVRLHVAADGLGSTFAELTGYSIAKIRKAHRLVTAAEDACQPESIGLAGAMMEVACDWRLPATYRRYLAAKVEEIYQRRLEPDDARWLTLQSVIAYSLDENAALAQKESAFRLLVALQEERGASDQERAAALGNLACVCQNSRRFKEAADLFARAAKLAYGEGGMFLTSKEAECRAQLGDYKMAYELVSDFPDEYFSLRESEWSECARDCLREPAIFKD